MLSRLRAEERRAGRRADHPLLQDAVALRARVEAAGDARREIVALFPHEARDRMHRDALFQRLQQCVHPTFYRRQLAQRGQESAGLEGDPEAAARHWLAVGAFAGLRPSALFHPDTYRERLAERGLALPAEGDLFLHWLTVGFHERIVPTPLYDEEFHVGRNPHLAEAFPWPFWRWMSFGCLRPSPAPHPAGKFHYGTPVVDPAAQEPLLLQELLHRADDFDLSRTSWLEERAVLAQRRRASLETPEVAALVAKAAALEPLIHAPFGVVPEATYPPYLAPRMLLAEQIEELRHGVGVVGTRALVLAGGRLAGDLAAALGDTDRTDVLLVQTEGAPADPRAVDLGAYDPGFDTERCGLLLMDLVRGLRPDRLVVADSELGWELFAAYARQLSAQAQVRAYLPAPQPDDRGRETGVAVTHLAACLPYLTELVAGPAAADQVATRYLLSDAERARLVSVAEDRDLATALLAGLEGVAP